MKKVVGKDSSNRSVEVEVFETSDFISTYSGTVQEPVKTGTDGKIDSTLLPASTATAAKEISIAVVYGETISALKLIYLGTDGKAYIAKSNVDYATAAALGMAMTAGAANSTGTILIFGKYYDASLSLPLNSDLYLNSAGNFTTTAPTTGFITYVGRSLGSGNIFLTINKPIIL